MTIRENKRYEIVEAHLQYGLPEIYETKEEAVIAMNDILLREQDGGYNPSFLRVLEVKTVRIWDDGIAFEQVTKTCVYK